MVVLADVVTRKLTKRFLVSEAGETAAASEGVGGDLTRVDVVSSIVSF